MKLDQLQYFVTTAETQHVGKSSKILNISPSAISHSIRQLEDELGAELFSKRGKCIYLTDFGHQFANRAKELLLQAENLKSEFTDSEKKLAGTYRMAATHSLNENIIVPKLAKLLSENPDLIIENYSYRSADVKKRVVNAEVDFGFLYSPAAHPQMDILSKFETGFSIVTRKAHSLQKKPVSAQIISSYPCASPKAFSGIAICENHPQLKKLGVSQNISFIFDSYSVAANYLKNSDAWALFPDDLIKSYGLKAIDLKALKVKENYCLVTPKGRSLPTKILSAFS